MKSLSCVRLFATPCTVVYQALLSMVFSKQEYWSGLPFPSPEMFPTQGLNPPLWCLLHCRWILYHRVTWEAQTTSKRQWFSKTGIILLKKMQNYFENFTLIYNNNIIFILIYKVNTSKKQCLQHHILCQLTFT